eukprot:328421_1
MWTLISCIIISKLIILNGKPQSSPTTPKECEYHNNISYTTSMSQLASYPIHISNNSIELQFKIKLHDYSNIGSSSIINFNNNFLSLSINGILNYLEITSKTNSDSNNVFRIFGIYDVIPPDHQYHDVYLSYSYLTNNSYYLQNTIKIDNFVSYYHGPINMPTPFDQSYSLYVGDPSHSFLNGSISNICITSPLIVGHTYIFESEIHCGDIINGELISQYDIDYYYFELKMSGINVWFNACQGMDTYLSLYSMNFTAIETTFHECFANMQLFLPSLSADRYILEVSGSGDMYDISHDYGLYHLEITCSNNNEFVTEDTQENQTVDTDYNYYDTSYYFLSNPALEWFEAEKQCEEFNTTLATITTTDDFQRAIEVINKGIGYY